MKKRLLAMVAALSMAMVFVTPVCAAEINWNRINWDSTDWTDSSYWDDVDDITEYQPTSQDYRTVANSLINAKEANANSSKIRVSGPTNAQVGIVYSNDYDNLYDSGIYPTVYEFAKNSVNGIVGKDNVSKAYGQDIDSIYYFNLKADEPGQVTFKLDSGSVTPGGYAIVLHYTGNPQDEDGVTAQYVKISNSGSVSAYYNSYGPVAIIATDVNSAQKLVNTYYLTAGTDQAMGLSATIAAGENMPVFILTGIAVVAVIAGTVVYKKKKKGQAA